MKPIAEKWLTSLHDTLNEYIQIPETEWEKILSELNYLEIKKNEYFIKTGDVPDKLAFIISGVFRVFYIADSGDEKTMTFRQENRLLSGYSALLENTESKYSIQALEDSCLLYAPINNFKQQVSGRPYWQLLEAKYTRMLYLEKEKREYEFLCNDAETRYHNFINEYPSLEKRLHQYHIASYLGITPVALSRLRKNEKKADIFQN